tara:strand:+ start:247 stop:2832 length:2586 start_codon:yes stop_codon:yes gene_type:complete
MPKQLLSLNNFSGGINDLKDPRDIDASEFSLANNIMVDQQGAIRTRGNADTHGYIDSQAATLSGGYGLALLESDYRTEPVVIQSTSDFYFGEASGNTSIRKSTVATIINGGTNTITTDVAHHFSVGDTFGLRNSTNYNTSSTNRLTVLTVPSSTTLTVELADEATEGNGSGTVGYLEDGFTRISEGDEFILEGTTNNDGFYSVRYHHSVSSLTYLYVTPNFPDDDDASESGTITHLPREDNLFLLSDANTSTVDVYSTNTDTWSSAQITITNNATNSSKTVYYSINNAIRVSDANFENSGLIKWFGYIKRIHFEKTTAEDNYGPNWFEYENTLLAPTYGLIHASNYPTANSGFNITVTHTANTNSTWDGDGSTAYQVAFSFIYDENQESKLYIPNSSNTFTPDAGDSVTVVVRAQTDSDGYNKRITGGRVYAKQDGSDEHWFLLCDIDMRRGSRATLNSEYTAWATASTTTTSTGAVESINKNLDTYESLNGFSSTIESISIGEEGEQWKYGLVSNRRAFLFNVKSKDPNTGDLVNYGDRVYFSEIGKFDTFPTSNYIDVVLGDSESYIGASSYADRILAFKQNSVQTINISSPSPSGWFLENNYDKMGILHPAAVVKTEFGCSWVNKNGCYFYNGNNISNLIDNKIDDNTWYDYITTTASTGFSIIGYESSKKQLFVMRDCTATEGTDSSDCYIYDFKSRSWVFAEDAFTSNVVTSNFINDTTGKLTLGITNSSNIDFKEWDDDDTGTVSGIKFNTKDIDFGQPGTIKKIYKVYITYKNNGAALSNDLKYATNGNTTFANTNLTSSFSDSKTDWEVAVCSFSSPVSCQSIAFQIDAGSATRLSVNDITIEYRIINNKRVS